jgi:hypothetical protein
MLNPRIRIMFYLVQRASRPKTENSMSYMRKLASDEKDNKTSIQLAWTENVLSNLT